MAKKIEGYIKLQIPAGKANPSPPVGPALGQRGLNIMQFCKEFNAATQQMEAGMPIPVVITAFSDRSFTFSPRRAGQIFLKKAARSRRARRPPAAVSSAVTRAQCRAIASRRWRSQTRRTSRCGQMIKGPKSMGLQVVEGITDGRKEYKAVASNIDRDKFYGVRMP